MAADYIYVREQAKSKEVDSLSSVLKEKDELMAQKQRQIDSLLAAIGARPAATGVHPTYTTVLDLIVKQCSTVHGCSFRCLEFVHL